MINRIKHFLYFYRIIHRHDKVGWSRCMAYILLAYSVSSQWDIKLMIINFVIIFSIMMSAYALNNYYDYKLLNEKNYIGELILKKQITETRAKIYAFLPALSLVLIIFLNFYAQALLLIFFIISQLYSLPLARLKEKFGLIYSPLIAFLGFIESVILVGELSQSILCLAILIFLLHIYAELIHVLEDDKNKKHREKALQILKIYPILTFLYCLYFSVLNLVFIIGAIFSIIRLVSVNKIKISSDFNKIHRNIMSPIYSAQEFGIYAIFGLVGFFR